MISFLFFCTLKKKNRVLYFIIWEMLVGSGDEAFAGNHEL